VIPIGISPAALGFSLFMFYYKSNTEDRMRAELNIETGIALSMKHLLKLCVDAYKREEKV
jgi:hypothetical protein